ncbi:MAG TPA: TRAP transporter large permease subunit [Falsiroseomonas sp.]|jgi:tripartite ATP-independent transporter DctM subunit|nr:TRAP transporter large permease subunit [Falsiroseomonas sp.]
MTGFGIAEAAIGFVLTLALMVAGLHVGVVMAVIALLGADLYLGGPVINALGTQFWGATDTFTLLAVPLFVLQGELLVRGGATDRLYKALAAWLGPLPGGLLHTNIGACAMFAVVSGPSVATAATIGTVALPTFADRRHNERLVLGTIAAGSTLGIPIPTSINMIIYGAMTSTSVGRLYAAGVLPGLLLTGLFMVVIVVLCILRPALGGQREPLLPLGARLRALGGLAPPRREGVTP